MTAAERADQVAPPRHFTFVVPNDWARSGSANARTARTTSGASRAGIVDADGDPTAIELVLTWTLLQEGDEFALMADEGARLLLITTG